MEEKSEMEFLKKAKEKIFSKEPLSKGEWIQIILVITLIAVMIFLYFSTTCTLDCSMCESTNSILKQTGFG